MTANHQEKLHQPFHSISRDNNMMVVRYYLSFCVLIAHTAVLTGLDLPWIQRGTVDVGCFFAISGFLMFPSYQKRPTLRHYVSRRARRLLPPYILIILLCAIGFVTISSLSITDYFTDGGFWKYIIANLTFLNFLHPSLPGVFEGNEFVTNAVNGSLWTMKGEWVCYLSVPPVFWAVKRLGNNGGFLLAFIALLSILFRLTFLYFAESSGHYIYDIIAKQFGTLLVFFYIGAFINFYYEYFLKFKWIIIGVDVVILILADYIPFYTTALQPMVAGSLVLWFSMVGNWGRFLARHDSVSYDIYLFHFPIIQLCILWGLPDKLPPLGVLGVIVSITVVFAFISWNLVGRRFMQRKA
jgi:acyltransferase